MDQQQRYEQRHARARVVMPKMLVLAAKQNGLAIRAPRNKSRSQLLPNFHLPPRQHCRYVRQHTSLARNSNSCHSAHRWQRGKVHKASLREAGILLSLATPLHLISTNITLILLSISQQSCPLASFSLRLPRQTTKPSTYCSTNSATGSATMEKAISDS
jgi:hypothetical protein